MRKMSIILLLAVLTGCAVWQKTGGSFAGAGFSLDLPEGWMMSGKPDNLTVTRDGRLLQSIIVLAIDINKQDSKAKKAFKKGMLPQEASEVIVDLMQNDHGIAQFTVTENTPLTIGGAEGFRLTYTYLRSKVRYKSVYYGVLRGEKFYRVSYTAPVRHYFEKDVAAFEEIVRSFKLTGAAS